MKLRNLKTKDAPFMYEWMKDKNVVKELHVNFSEKTLDDCFQFIKKSKIDKRNIHFAVVDDRDEYMGTVSLKNIDNKNKRAEFAIVIRKKAMGHGYSWYAMYEMLKYGFKEKKLTSIYWCVSKNNIRACKFYEKHGFSEFVDPDESILLTYRNVNNMRWFLAKASDIFIKHQPVDPPFFKLINIKTIGTENCGQLSFVESNKDLPFDIKRIYYITMVDEGVKRGFHAHKNLKQLIFCPHGIISLLLDNGTRKEEIMLDGPSFGVLIEKPLWREMTWIEKNSVLCVLASDFYDADDYIRDYQEFLSYVNDKR